MGNNTTTTGFLGFFQPYYLDCDGWKEHELYSPTMSYIYTLTPSSQYNYGEPWLRNDQMKYGGTTLATIWPKHQQKNI